MVRKKVQVCPICKKSAATLLEWPQRNWWPSILCWPCVQEHIEEDHEQLEAAHETSRQLIEVKNELVGQLDASRTATREVEQQLDRVQEQLEAAQQKLCGTCGGERVVDSGGFTPWDAPINVPCPECQGEATHLRERLEAAQRERDVAHNAWTDTWQELQAERTKREEAERRLGKVYEDMHFALGHHDAGSYGTFEHCDAPECRKNRAMLASQTKEKE